MRILLDESLPRQLGRDLPLHDVSTVTGLGWAGMKNGELLQLAQGRFDVFLTADRNLEYQQNVARLDLCIIVLLARNNRYRTLQPLVPELVETLHDARPGTVLHVGSGNERAHQPKR